MIRPRGCAGGNDIGTQYRSGIYVYVADPLRETDQSKIDYQKALAKAGIGTITTEIVAAPEFC